MEEIINELNELQVQSKELYRREMDLKSSAIKILNQKIGILKLEEKEIDLEIQTFTKDLLVKKSEVRKKLNDLNLELTSFLSQGSLK